MSAGSPHKRRSIFSTVTALSFSGRQEQDCIDYVAKRSASTEIVPISDEAQLTLTADGRLSESGYRFNVLGFISVCRAISTGLSRLFGEISGELPSRLVDIEACSIPSAVSIYNESLRVRFDSLRERSILVDHNERVIDGFLGLNHKLLDNSVFLELIQNERTAKTTETNFYRAELVGRELKVYILDPATRRTDIYTDPEHTFAAGWYFCNREDSGNSVRAVPCLYTRFGVAIAAEKQKQRLAHVGTDLAGRAGRLIASTLDQSFDFDELQKRVHALIEFKLGFTDVTAEFAGVSKKWSAYLVSAGIPKDMAKAIVKNAAMVGSDIVPRNPLDVYTKKVLVTRSGYDLVCAVLRYARNQPTHMREKMQAVGMSMLLPTAKKQFGV
jgi:hypothetical protein